MINVDIMTAVRYQVHAVAQMVRTCYIYFTYNKWNNVMFNQLDNHQLDTVFRLLDGRLLRTGAPPVHPVVCGGAAMIAVGLLSRTTRDVDIVALLDEGQRLVAPVPLPKHLLKAASEVAEVLNLPKDWLNNGPSRDEGGLFQMGLPDGLRERLHTRAYGSRLTVHFIDRLDQIHFKLYAAVDRGGYHVTDLEALKPTPPELSQAARWALTHDASEAFRRLLKRTLEGMEYGNVAETI